MTGALGDGLVAVWLYGSSVSDAFDPDISDIDLVAVTSREIDAIDLAGLGRMHDDAATRYTDWKDRIEVVYVSRAMLESFRTSTGALAVASPGEPLHLRGDRPSRWVQNWYLVRQTGISLFGPEPAEVIPPIEWAEFAAGLARYAGEVRDRSRVDAVGGVVAYDILTMCRALHTIWLGAISSKQESANWVRAQHPEWGRLVDEALACRASGGRIGLVDPRSREAAEVFIRFVANEIPYAGWSAVSSIP